MKLMTDLQLGQNPGNEGVIYDLKARFVFAPLLKEIKKPTSQDVQCSLNCSLIHAGILLPKLFCPTSLLEKIVLVIEKNFEFFFEITD